jgi:hypothetical protein
MNGGLSGNLEGRKNIKGAYNKLGRNTKRKSSPEDKIVPGVGLRGRDETEQRESDRLDTFLIFRITKRCFGLLCSRTKKWISGDSVVGAKKVNDAREGVPKGVTENSVACVSYWETFVH